MDDNTAERLAHVTNALTAAFALAHANQDDQGCQQITDMLMGHLATVAVLLAQDLHTTVNDYIAANKFGAHIASRMQAAPYN